MLKSLLSFVLVGFGAFGTIPSASHADGLKIAYNSDWPPYSSGAGGAVAGILPDLLQELVAGKMAHSTSHMGFPWKRAQHTVKTGKLDAMITVPTAQRLEWSHSSKSVVYEIEMRAIVKKGSKAEKALQANGDAAALSDFRICDILGNGWGARFMKKNNLRFETASNVERCLDMIDKGRMDVSIQSVAVANRKLNEQGLAERLRVLPTTYGAMGFTLLVSKKTPDAKSFLKKFDAVVSGMKEDGSLSALITRLRVK